MSSRAWYKWFPADWRGDTTFLSLEEKGAYRELLDALWTYGPLPDQPKVRATILGTYGRTTARLWTKLHPFFTISGGYFDHAKLALQREELLEIQEKRRLAGEKGGKAKAVASAIANASNAHDAPTRAIATHTHAAPSSSIKTTAAPAAALPPSDSPPPPRAPASTPAKPGRETLRAAAAAIQAEIDAKLASLRASGELDDRPGPVHIGRVHDASPTPNRANGADTDPGKAAPDGAVAGATV